MTGIDVSRGVPFALGIVALLVFWSLGAYNRLVALRGAIGAAFVQVDEQLRRRQALLQALLETLRPELPSELGALDAVANALQQVQASTESARARVCVAEPIERLAAYEVQLTAALARMGALIEQHAELRQREDVAPRTAELREIDVKLGFARQLFNDASLKYNGAVQQFPTRLLKPMFRFVEAGRL